MREESEAASRWNYFFKKRDPFRRDIGRHVRDAGDIGFGPGDVGDDPKKTGSATIKTPSTVSLDPVGMMGTTGNLPQSHYHNYSTIY